MFFKPKKCSCCGHKIYPLKDVTGRLIPQNLVYMDIMSIILVIGLICLLIGVNQINQQCYDIIENPCAFTHDSFGNDKCNTMMIRGVDENISTEDFARRIFGENS